MSFHYQSSSRMIIWCVVVLCSLGSTAALQGMLEMFEQVNGTDMVETNLRVRKINRTTAALYGNATIKEVMDNDYKFSVVLDHSPLGNNQFNRYPMKIGPMGWCDFTRTFWHEYYPYGAPYVENIWLPDECPSGPRVQIYNDLILDPKMFPRYLPPGLWRADLTMTKDGSGKLLFRFLVKAYESGHFGTKG